ncbi:MAG: APC family permease [Nitrososphaerales archaeon]
MKNSERSMKEDDASKSSAPFVREATGLVKNVSLLDAVAINVSYMSVGAALALVGFTMLALPSVSGVNLVIGSSIAAIFAIPQMIVYTIMQTRISRTGGDYVWMSRSLGGFVGSTVSFMGISLETMPYLALIALSTVFAIGSVGVVLGYPAAGDLAVAGLDPFMQFAIASSIIATLIWLNIVRPRLGYRIISACWIIGLLSIAVAVLSLLFAGKSGVEYYITSLRIANVTYSSIVDSYQGSTSFNLSATLLVIPFFALFSYPWLNAAPSVGSEMKQGRGIRWNAPISLLLAFILITVPFATMYYVGGFAFTNAALANSVLVNDFSFNFWTLAMGVSNNFLIQFFIGLGWILLTLSVLAFGIITISRYLLAQAFDRFLPEKLAYVSPKYQSPVIAHLFDLFITVALIALASFLYGTMFSLYGAVAASMIYFAFVGLAAVVYAIREERKGISKLVLATAGSMQVLVFAYLTYEFLAYPSIWGGNPLAYGYIVVSFAAGAVIYIISKLRNSSNGLDISLAFKEIPPE